MGAQPETTPVLSVIVCSSGTEIARVEIASLLSLPDGRPAVRWGGAAFPLLDGGRIEETGEAFPPALCSAYQEARPSWRLVELPQTGDAYVFIDGSSSERDAAVRHLQQAGTAVVRTGPNLSGEPGDWFILLSGITTANKAALVEAFGSGDGPVPSEAAEAIRERLLSDGLRAALARQEDLLLRMAELAVRSAGAEASLVRFQDEAQSLRQQLLELGRESAELRKVQAPPREIPRHLARLEAELGVMVEELLPRVDLIRDSLTFIAVELSDRRAVWRALGDLDRDMRGIPVGWKGVAGRQGWWERHVATGHDNQGRIYARREGSPARWKVLVSHKQQQDSDIRWLES